MKMTQKPTVLWYVLIFVRCLFYVIRHPRWTIHILRGYRQYQRDGGSFLDTDFYKLPMGQLYWRLPHLSAEYKLTVRDKNLVYPKGFGKRLRVLVNDFAANNGSITPVQRSWLDRLPFLASEFLNFLADPSKPKILAKHVHIKQVGGNLDVRVKGPVYQTTWWEIHLMKMISELYYEMMGIKPQGWGWIIRAGQKGLLLKWLLAIFSEFGTRRRMNFKVHFVVLATLVMSGSSKTKTSKGGLIGTSNVFLAHLFRLLPIGTMAHELFMILGAIYGYDKANQLVIKLWREEFGHDLGYFLPDTYGSDKFYETFTRDDALFFTGPRQDSGDPIWFIDLTVKTYQRLGLTPKQIAQRTIIFSDSIRSLEEVEKYRRHALSRGIGFAAYGIGTWFTNDAGPKHLNMVIKPERAWVGDNEEDWRGCVKTSDNPEGKTTGDPEAARLVQHWLETGEILWTPLIETLPVQL
jgi:nicotinate phosphoribosyltransferase